MDFASATMEVRSSAACRIFGLVLAILSLAGGCQHQGEPPPETPSEVTRYASLPLVRQSHKGELRIEVARILQEKGTPAQLQQASGTTSGGSDSAARSSTSTPVGLDDIYPPDSVNTIAAELETFYPAGHFLFPGPTLRKAVELRKTYDRLRQQARKRVADPQFRFGVQHDHGFMLDTSFVDAAKVAARIEALLAAESLYNDAPRGAIEPLEFMFKITEAMAREKHTVPRLAAVVMRAEALRVLEAIATHPRCDVPDHRRLAKLLRGTLDRWPPDAHAWIGDRAQGVHAYEMVRDGLLLSLLSYDELRSYRDEVTIAKLGEFVAENLDEDELFYLTTMRRVIEISQQPFYERRKYFRSMERQLHHLRMTAEYPLVADQLLLIGIELGHCQQAGDWARCEAWWLALSLALGDSVPKDRVNPVTGFPYIIDSDPTLIRVDGIDPERNEPAIEVQVCGARKSDDL